MCVHGGGIVYNSEKSKVMTYIFKNNIASQVIFLKAKKVTLSSRVSQGPLQ